MSNTKKAVGIIVGGGPAPGINGVISAATIEAINRGHKVIGIRRGFEYLMKGDISAGIELSIPQVSNIQSAGGSILATSRANPTKNPEDLARVVDSLRRLGIGYLVTIGGDDTASSARAVGQAANGEFAVAHVPKTIDNDLPLPEKFPTFGYQTAREVGTQITETLMYDALTTNRWYLVVAMGRKAGHLALGIGLSSGATLTMIPEEFGDKKVPLGVFVDLIVSSIIKQMVYDRPYGVGVLAEGLAERIEESSIPELKDAERDPHGHIRYAELDFGGLIRRAVRERLRQLNMAKLIVMEKNVGYELRCATANAFDREYTRLLGFGVVDFLLQGGTEAMISRQRDNLIPIPFHQMMDRETGKTKVRFVDTQADVYRAAKKYMIRLTQSDLENPEFLEKASAITGLSIEEFKKQFEFAASFYAGFSDGYRQWPLEG